MLITNPLAELREILAIVRQDKHLLHRIIEHIGLKPLTAAIAVRFTGDSAMNSLVLNVGQKSMASILPLLADGVSPSNGVVSGVGFSFNDPSATVAMNPDNVTAEVAGVAASAGPVGGTATCTVTDTDGVVSTWTQPFTIQVNAVAPPPPQQLTQSVAVQFTAPA